MVDARTPVSVGVGQSAENIGDSSYRGMSSVELVALSDTGVDTAVRDFRTDARAAGQVEQLLADGCAAYRRCPRARDPRADRRSGAAASGHRVRERDRRRQLR